MRPVFQSVHIDTPTRFVGTRKGVRLSIALGDMGLWEVDAYRAGECLVDDFIVAKGMDDAIDKTLAMAGVYSDAPNS